MIHFTHHGLYFLMQSLHYHLDHLLTRLSASATGISTVVHTHLETRVGTTATGCFFTHNNIHVCCRKLGISTLNVSGDQEYVFISAFPYRQKMVYMTLDA